MVWTNPSSRPHPRKRRFAQGRRDSTAVQILSPDFLGLSNYKAIAQACAFSSPFWALTSAFALKWLAPRETLTPAGFPKWERLLSALLVFG
jgi:hypothetical protein